MNRSGPRRALLIKLRNGLEHNPPVAYKTVFVGEALWLFAAAGWEHEVIDLDDPAMSLTYVLGRLTTRPDVLLLWCDVHQSRLARQIASIARTACPGTRIFVYGRATSFIPQFFEREPFDFVHVTGDREAAIASLIAVIEAGGGQIDGCSQRDSEGIFHRTHGRLLPPQRWPFPLLDSPTLRKYRELALAQHADGYTPRISVTVSKGCELRCAYCDAWREEGVHDRRRPISALMDWLHAVTLPDRDTLLHLFSPDLFVDPQWIRAFAVALQAKRPDLRWRGVTTTRALLDRDTVLAAGVGGCTELAIGIETVDADKLTSAKSSIDEIREAARNCADAGIMLKGLVMLGYPRQSANDVEFIENLADELGLLIRYTGYTPLHRLQSLTPAQLDGIALEAWDRRTYYDPGASSLSAEFFYKRISTAGGYYVPRARRECIEASTS